MRVRVVGSVVNLYQSTPKLEISALIVVLDGDMKTHHPEYRPVLLIILLGLNK
jgi:hypothetical protein